MNSNNGLLIMVLLANIGTAVSIIVSNHPHLHRHHFFSNPRMPEASAYICGSDFIL